MLRVRVQGPVNTLDGVDTRPSAPGQSTEEFVLASHGWPTSLRMSLPMTSERDSTSHVTGSCRLSASKARRVSLLIVVDVNLLLSNLPTILA